MQKWTFSSLANALMKILITQIQFKRCFVQFQGCFMIGMRYFLYIFRMTLYLCSRRTIHYFEFLILFHFYHPYFPLAFVQKGEFHWMMIISIKFSKNILAACCLKERIFEKYFSLIRFIAVAIIFYYQGLFLNKA